MTARYSAALETGERSVLEVSPDRLRRVLIGGPGGQRAREVAAVGYRWQERTTPGGARGLRLGRQRDREMA
jgi:hypothetical protein